MCVRPAARHRHNIPPPAEPRPADATTIAPQLLHVGRHRGGNFAVDGVRQHRIRRDVEWIIHRGKTTLSSTVTSSVDAGVATRLSPSRTHAAGRHKDLVPLPPPIRPQVYPISQPPTCPVPRREHGEYRPREAAETSAWGTAPPCPESRCARCGRPQRSDPPRPQRASNGSPETVRLVQAFLGLDSDRRIVDGPGKRQFRAVRIEI